MRSVEISQENIINNINEVRKLQPNKDIMVVVKGNAYGHGVLEVTKALINSGVNRFCVATLDEAIELRKSFKDIKICLLYGIFDQDINKIKEYNIEVTITNKLD